MTVGTPNFSLDGRVAVVTGALGLLGRGICRALAGAGAKVVAADLDSAASQRFAEELSAEFAGAARVAGLPLDVTDSGSVEALRDRVLAASGHVDVLVNAAALDDKVDPGDGVGGTAAEASRFENLSLERWRRSLEVNLTGAFLTCQILGAQMARQGRGSIVNFGSTYGLVAPDQRIYRGPDGSQRFWKSAAYPTVKAGIVGFTRFLATYWAQAGVRANVLCPGGVFAGQDETFVATYSARTPLARLAAPEEMQGAVIFLASEASSYMTGSTLVVDGGWTAW